MEDEEKAKLFPVYLNFLRKNVDNIAVIRQAERSRLEVERRVRTNMLAQRRELAKDVNNANEIMDRWVRFIESNGPDED